MANESNGRGRLEQEASVRRTLSELLEAGGIETRSKTDAPSVTGLIKLGPDADELLVDKTAFANLERLEARGLARRVVDVKISPSGRVETEKFLPTEFGASVLFHGMDNVALEPVDG